MVRELLKRGTRVACLSACAGAAMLALPALASAGTVSIDSGKAHFVGGSGEYNSIQITDTGSAIRFTALKGPVFASGVGCGNVGPPGDTVDCTKVGVTGLLVDLGVGVDKVKNDVDLPMTANGGADNDTLIGGPADDKLNGESGQDFLDGRGGADTMNGGTAVDYASYVSRRHRVYVSIDGRANDGQRGEGDNVRTEAVLGGRLSDTLRGGPHANILAGGRGADRLVGYGGRDQLVGGPGNDRLYGGNQNDQLIAGRGADRLRAGNGIDLLNAGNDGNADSVNCGANFDFAVVHRHDRVRNCESVSFRG